VAFFFLWFFYSLIVCLSMCALSEAAGPVCTRCPSTGLGHLPVLFPVFLTCYLNQYAPVSGFFLLRHTLNPMLKCFCPPLCMYIETCRPVMVLFNDVVSSAPLLARLQTTPSIVLPSAISVVTYPKRFSPIPFRGDFFCQPCIVSSTAPRRSCL